MDDIREVGGWHVMKRGKWEGGGEGIRNIQSYSIITHLIKELLRRTNMFGISSI